VAVVDRAPRLASSEASREAARARLAELGLGTGEPYLLLDASGRPGSAKAAPAELWAGVIEELARRSRPRVVVVGAPGEQALARRTLELAPGAGAVLFDEPPPTLGELLALIEGCALFLGADSGPRHLATASGRPQVVLCGPTDPRHTADHNGRTRVLRLVVDCGPCHLERCPLPAPETGHCLARLAIAPIVEALFEVL
jgi:ADP-heptose:LPS heptosyltransferase